MRRPARVKTQDSVGSCNKRSLFRLFRTLSRDSVSYFSNNVNGRGHVYFAGFRGVLGESVGLLGLPHCGRCGSDTLPARSTLLADVKMTRYLDERRSQDEDAALR